MIEIFPYPNFTCRSCDFFAVCNYIITAVENGQKGIAFFIPFVMSGTVYFEQFEKIITLFIIIIF